jgi:DNA polymerase-4
MNVLKGLDLKKMEKQDLLRFFGKNGGFFYDIVRGIDLRAVNPDRIRKSLGIENTFSKDLDNLREMFNALEALTNEFVDRLEKYHTYGRTLTLKIKFADFKQITRSKTLPHLLKSKDIIYNVAEELLINALTNREVTIRLLGISISNLDEPEIDVKGQLSLGF